MIDEKLILTKLKELEERLSLLENLSRHEFAVFKKNTEKQWAAERGLQVAVQIVIDIASHILAEKGEAGIEDYSAVIERLGKIGVIPKGFAAEIKGMAGFRNILVHEYAKVDIEKVYDMLKNRLSDFKRFAGYINKHLNKRAYGQKE